MKYSEYKTDLSQYNFTWNGCRIRFGRFPDTDNIVVEITKENKCRTYVLNNTVRFKNHYDAFGEFIFSEMIDESEERIEEFINLIKGGVVELL